MNSQLLLEKLKASEEFKKFKEENPSAYFCSGFFVIDLESKKSDNKFHFDYYVPERKKTFSFELEDGIRLIPLERNDEQILEEISMKNHFDFEKIKEKILTEMELKGVHNQMQKMIFSLQSKNKEDFLIGTIFLSGLSMLKVNINLNQNIITDFEKKSLFDMMKFMKK
jgi:hypothetical protein